MKNVIIIFFICLTSCNKHEESKKIEKFVWIKDNHNWIYQPSDLRAIEFIEYVDSIKVLKYSKYNTTTKQFEFYSNKAPDTLSILINDYLSEKNYPKSLIEKKGERHFYEGVGYNIIYKFKNEPEKIINYLPFTLPDSLKGFIYYIENLNKLNGYQSVDSFDIQKIVDKYKHIMIGKSKLAPPPAPSGQEAKFKTDKSRR